VWLVTSISHAPALLCAAILLAAFVLPSQIMRFWAFSGTIAIIVLLAWDLASGDPRLQPALLMSAWKTWPSGLPSSWSSPQPCLRASRGRFSPRDWRSVAEIQSFAAISASLATVFMLRAVPCFAAGIFSLDLPMPLP
jgi:hypothetical protein